jgi:hypothetical protein
MPSALPRVVHKLSYTLHTAVGTRLQHVPDKCACFVAKTRSVVMHRAVQEKKGRAKGYGVGGGDLLIKTFHSLNFIR